MLTTEQIIKKYGKPSQNGSPYLISIKLPYPMKLAWDKNTKVTTMRCHKLVADKFLAVFNDILKVYGYEKIVELGIDLFDSVSVVARPTRVSVEAGGVQVLVWSLDCIKSISTYLSVAAKIVVVIIKLKNNIVFFIILSFYLIQTKLNHPT